MPKGMVMQIIFKIYELKKGDLNTELSEYMLNKYGLPAVADKKLKQFINGIYLYQGQYPKVRLFGRLSGILKPKMEVHKKY